jgi:hypothetical protein
MLLIATQSGFDAFALVRSRAVPPRAAMAQPATLTVGTQAATLNGVPVRFVKSVVVNAES